MPPSEPVPLDAQHCPLCGESNACEVATGGTIEACWCTQTAISPEALSQIPEEARGLRCICARCGRNLSEAAVLSAGRDPYSL